MEVEQVRKSVVDSVIPAILAVECTLLGSRSEVVPFGIYDSVMRKGQERTPGPLPYEDAQCRDCGIFSVENQVVKSKEGRYAYRCLVHNYEPHYHMTPLQTLEYKRDRMTPLCQTCGADCGRRAPRYLECTARNRRGYKHCCRYCVPGAVNKFAAGSMGHTRACDARHKMYQVFMKKNRANDVEEVVPTSGQIHDNLPRVLGMLLPFLRTSTHGRRGIIARSLCQNLTGEEIRQFMREEGEARSNQNTVPADAPADLAIDLDRLKERVAAASSDLDVLTATLMEDSEILPSKNKSFQ